MKRYIVEPGEYGPSRGTRHLIFRIRDLRPEPQPFGRHMYNTSRMPVVANSPDGLIAGRICNMLNEEPKPAQSFDLEYWRALTAMYQTQMLSAQAELRTVKTQLTELAASLKVWP